MVSEDAWRQGGAPSRGSTMFAELGSSIRVDDLIRGIIIQSGNDACIVLAEGMAGSQEAFADVDEQGGGAARPRQSHFTNPTGYADPDQYMTARDLAKLASTSDPRVPRVLQDLLRSRSSPGTRSASATATRCSR